MKTESHRKNILQIFKNRGVKANEFYPLPEFMEDVGLPHEEEAVEAFQELVEKGFLVECSAAIELTEKGAKAIDNL